MEKKRLYRPTLIDVELRSTEQLLHLEEQIVMMSESASLTSESANRIEAVAVNIDVSPLPAMSVLCVKRRPSFLPDMVETVEMAESDTFQDAHG